MRYHCSDMRTGQLKSAGLREKPSGQRSTGEHDMQILLVAFLAIAGIWLVVLWGSRYLGPR
jgi:hypothetical protein